MRKTVSSFLFLGLAVLIFIGCNSSTGSASGNDSSGATSKDTSDVTKNWKLGVQTWTFHFYPFVEGINKIDSAGIKFIEANPNYPLGDGMKDSFGIRISDSSKAKLKQILESKGMHIVAMGVVVPKNMAEWKQYFDLAKDFGMSYITAEPHKDQLNQIDSMAAVYGIKVAIHDHPKPNMYWSPDSVLAAIAGHPNIGSCADVGHWSRNGLDPVECLKKLAGHVYGVHLKDIKEFDKVEAADTVVGKGVNKFPEIFAELKRQGFSGMLSIEQESNWFHNVPDIINTRKYFEAEVAKLK